MQVAKGMNKEDIDISEAAELKKSEASVGEAVSRINLLPISHTAE